MCLKTVFSRIMRLNIAEYCKISCKSTDGKRIFGPSRGIYLIAHECTPIVWRQMRVNIYSALNLAEVCRKKEQNVET